MAALSTETQDALMHARARWVGAPLLFGASAQVIWALIHAALGGAWLPLLAALTGAMLALASFGANHDAAMALLLRLRVDDGPVRGVPESLLAELDEELQRDRDGMMGLQPRSRVARLLPILAMLVQAAVAWWLLRG